MMRNAVFISSTYDDLADYRLVVRDVALDLDFFPIMMEVFPAADRSSVDNVLRKIDEASVYIGIFAHRYGYCPAGSSTSITEIEYDYATSKGIPCLCFLIDEEFSWPTKYIDEDLNKSKLQQLKNKISTNLTIQKFTTPDSLRRTIATSLSAQKQGKEFDVNLGPYDAKIIPTNTITDDKQNSKLTISLDISRDNFDPDLLINLISKLVSVGVKDVTIVNISEG